MKYKIILKQSEEGYSISCPALPGCYSQGKTEQESINNISEAIKECLAALEDSLKEGDIREVEIVV